MSRWDILSFFSQIHPGDKSSSSQERLKEGVETNWKTTSKVPDKTSKTEALNAGFPNSRIYILHTPCNISTYI